MERTHKELLQSMEQCKVVAAERDLLKELTELRAAVQAMVAMVDPVEEGSIEGKTWVERLREAPQRIAQSGPPRIILCMS